MTHWYTADTHFGHENIIRFCKRPFETVGEMDAALITNLWAHVGPEDDLWIIGDFAFGRKSKDVPWLESIFNQLPGARKHLVIGNHDQKPTLDLPWHTITDIANVQDGPDKQIHTLCHYPMITWNRARYGALQLFGHVHNNWKGSRNSVNVGVDVWGFRPITIREITARARKIAAK